MDNPYFEKVIELEKKIALLRDAVANAVGSIEGVFACQRAGVYTDYLALMEIKKIKDQLWARKCELFDVKEVK